MPQDLFEINEINSLGGQFYKNKTASIRNKKEEIIRIPNTFKLIKLHLPNTNYHSELEEFVDKLFKKARRNKMPEQFQVAVYETILNAHQHGHDKNPEKEIKIHLLEQKDTIRMYVSDEGGAFPAELIPYIQKIRQTNLKKTNLNFYKFSGRKKNKENNNLGSGTYFINLYSDDVRYYKNKDEGLTVYLLKKWNNKRI